MSILSSILGIGGNQPQPVAGPALATQKIPEELAPYYKDILGKAQALYKEKTAEGFQPYQGPTIAQFTPEQEQAFTGLAGLTGQQAPVFQEAMDMTRAAAAPMTAEQVTEYMSPYQQAVVDIEKREAQKQYESQVVPQLAAKAATTGGFGGSRQAILEGMAADTQQRLLGDIQAKGSQQAYEDAVKRFAADRQASGQAGAQLATMAPQQFKAQLGEFGALQTVGEQKQRQAQTALDEAFRQYTREQEYPYTTLGRYQATVTGAPIGTTQFAQPTPPPPTLGQTLIGGLGTAAGLYGAFTGKNPLNLITGKKHGGGLSDLPVVNAQDGLYLRRGISARNPYEKYMVPMQLGTVYDDKGIYRLQSEEKNKKDPSASSFTASIEDIMDLQDEMNVDQITGDLIEPLKKIEPEQKDTRPPLEAFRQIGDRGLPGQPGRSIIAPTTFFGRDPLQKIKRPKSHDPSIGTYGEDDREWYTADGVEFYQRPVPGKTPIIKGETGRDVGVINQPPGVGGVEGDLPDMVTQTPQLDTAGMSEQIAIQQKEDAIRKAMAAQAGRYDERLAKIDDERTRDQYANLASFFSRMGTATPRRGGLLGVVDAAMQVGPESISAMKETNKEFRDRRESLEDKREDIKLIAMKEDLGMTLSKQDRKIKADAVKESKRQFNELYKIKKEEIEIARETAALPKDIKDAYLNNIQQRPKDFIEDYKGYKSEDGSIIIGNDGEIRGDPDKARSVRDQIRNLKQDIELEVLSPPYKGDYNSWMRDGGNQRYDAQLRLIFGMSQASGSGLNTAEIQ